MLRTGAATTVLKGSADCCFRPRAALLHFVLSGRAAPVACPDQRCGDNGPMAITFGPVIPVLRMFDLASTQRFYCEYLGCTIDWQDGQDDGPIYLQVSRDGVLLHLSSHHGDGTPGGAVLIEMTGLAALHRELHDRSYPFMNPGLEPHAAGREMTLIDPASNLLRFFERERVTGAEG